MRHTTLVRSDQWADEDYPMHHGECSTCGWVGPDRERYVHAAQDVAEHEASVR